MVKIDLNTPLLNLEGKVSIIDEKEILLCKLLGNHLVAGSKGDVLKYYDWAVALYACKTIEVDKSDALKIKAFIEQSEGLSILSKAQMLPIIDECIKAEQK